MPRSVTRATSVWTINHVEKLGEICMYKMCDMSDQIHFKFPLFVGPHYILTIRIKRYVVRFGEGRIQLFYSCVKQRMRKLAPRNINFKKRFIKCPSVKPISFVYQLDRRGFIW